MNKACYKHGLFAIPYMMPLPGLLVLYRCKKREGAGKGEGGGCCDAPPWFSDFVPARKGGGRGGLVCPLPSSLVFLHARKGGEGRELQCPSLALLLRELWCASDISCCMNRTEHKGTCWPLPLNFAIVR